MKMNKKPLFWILYPCFLIISMSALLFVSIHYYLALKDFSIDKNIDFLKQRISTLESHWLKTPLNQLQVDASLFGDSRVTLIDDNGKVLFDSQKDNSTMDDHMLRPEVVEADNTVYGQAIRYSNTLQRQFVYLAKKINYNGASYYIRASRPLDQVYKDLSPLSSKMLWVLLIITSMITVVSWWVSKSLTRPIELMQLQAQKLYEGEVFSEVMISHWNIKEYSNLSEAIKHLSQQLKKRYETISKQKMQRDAVFSSLDAGVVAVNNRQIVLAMNDKCFELLGISKVDFKNKSLQEVLRVVEVQAFIKSALSTARAEEKEILLKSKSPEQHLLLRSSLLKGGDDEFKGVVVSISDITQLKKLAQLRQEFVANVSHELKTPLTSIQGYTETLIETPDLTAEQQQNFLSIIQRQATGLGGMVDDLLSLASIESLDEAENVSQYSANEIVQSVMDKFDNVAAEKQVDLSLHVDDENILITAWPRLLEQALSNLVKNAIIHTPKGGKVSLHLLVTNEAVEFKVADTGSGIAAEHLPRIFERFYRVDASRSDQKNGTGLGLAIVKHIVKVHQGRISATSDLGQGSQFTIQLPKL